MPKRSRIVGARSIDWVSRAARVPARSGRRGSWMNRGYGHLLVDVHPVLGPEIMLAEQKAVVRRDDQRGVLPHVVLVELVEQLAEQEVAHRDDGVVVGAQLLAFLRKLVDAAVARPVADRAVPAGLERLLEALWRLEGLMRIECFDLQHPIVRVAVALEEIEAVREALHRGKVFLLPDEFAVDDVLAEISPALIGELPLVIHLAQPLPVRLHHRLPRVALLPAHELVGVVAVVVGRAAILPIVEVVGDQVAVDAGLVQDLRKGVVEGLHRPPTPVQEGKPACQHVAARRHARQRAYVMAVVRARALGQPVEVRRRDALAAVRAEHVAIQRVEQHEHAFHGRSLLTSRHPWSVPSRCTAGKR